jgi:hypothetical protein
MNSVVVNSSPSIRPRMSLIVGARKAEMASTRSGRSSAGSRGGFRSLCSLELPVVVALFGPTTQDAAPKAPQRASRIRDAEAPAAPVAVIPQGPDVVSTGGAALGFLAVYYDGQAVRVPAQYRSLSVRPAIGTGVTIADTPFPDAPMRAASALEMIRKGQAVHLTGGRVDG